MADLKISQLIGATTPLAGTEVLPVVQSGATVKVSVDNLTAGKAVSVGSLTNAGNLGFTGTGNRITGDFSNATIANNVIFQTSTTNSATYIRAMPNGTSSAAGVQAYASSSDLANTSFFQTRIGLDNNECALYSNRSGTGTYLPMTFYAGGSEKVRLSTSGDVTVNTGNLIQGTAAKGINFTANTPAAGMTSQLLNWYEEGTWTPADASGAGLTFTGLSGNCYYTRVGNVVTLIFNITYPSTADTTSTSVSGLPFTSKNTTNSVAGGHLSYTNAGKEISCIVVNNSTSFSMYDNAGNTIKNNELSGKIIRGSLTYLV